jgi:hypothetical protein
MAATLVQTITGGSVKWLSYAGSTQNLTFASPVATGNSVIVKVAGYQGAGFTMTAPTDTASNVYAVPQDSVSGDADSGVASAIQAVIYVSHDVTGGFTVVTLNGLAGSGVYGEATAEEWSGLDALPNDRASAANLYASSNTRANVAVGTLAEAVELVQVVMGVYNGLDPINRTGPTGGPASYTSAFYEEDALNTLGDSSDWGITAAATAFTVQYGYDHPGGTQEWAIAVATFRIAAAGAPVFDSAPAIQSETTSAYTVAYDGGAAADNIYAGVWSTVATPPTAAQVEAGTGARGTATEAVTGAADTLVLTPTDSPVFPIYKLYFALKDGATYSGVASLTPLLDPPIGYQHIMVAGTPVGFLLGSGAAAGDVIQVQTSVVPGGYALTVNPDGSFSYPAIGDGTRQSFLAWYYDASAVAWADTAPVTIYVNNVAPILATGVGTPVEISVLEDIAISAVDVSTRGQDQEGDALTVTTQTGTLPTGLSLSTPNITGTPTTVGITRTVQRLTDVAGDSLDVEFAWVIRPVRPLFVGTVSDVDLSTPTFPVTDYSSEFTHDLGESEALTYTLKQVGTGALASTTVGSAAFGTAMTLVSASAISAGDYISTESDTEPNLVLAKYTNTLELNRQTTWTDGEDVARHVATTFAPGWMSLSSSGVLTGTTVGNNEASNLAVRATDGAGRIDDSTLFDAVVSNEAPFWGAGLNKVFRFVLGVGTDTIDFAPFWTDPENDDIVEYQLDFSESGTDASLPAGWSFNTSTGVMTVNIATAGVHTDWLMTAEDEFGAIGTSATFDIVIVAVQIVTFRFEMS